MSRPCAASASNVKGVVGSSPGPGSGQGSAAGLPPAYESFDDVLADPEIDAVHIASPNHLHADQVRAVLAAGKHVICEKPLAVSSEETADLVRAGRPPPGWSTPSASTSASIRSATRCGPWWHRARLDAPRFVTGSYLQDWLLLETDWNWRLVPEQAGELRSVADIGSHWLDLSRFITGRRVVEVMADLHTFVPIRRHPPGPVETFAAETRIAERSWSRRR